MAGGALGGGGNRGKLITEINVTPFVDIVLVLLIIFMVTASYIVRDSLEVKLPEAASGEPQKLSILAVVVLADGTLKIDGQATSEGELRAYIRQQKKSGPLEAVIAADKDAKHGTVVRVIDLVRSEGVTKFAINVLKKSAETKPGG
ncbi:MAG: biopolymer transporter ExbD [Deltaproteobacteria bacterium]|nr:biopolymer transporter ExbD [Deltaproteobacteria bacterium]